MSDDILRRHGLKAFSSPYSPCRSNIDYAMALEKCDFEGFLDQHNLKYAEADGKRVVRSVLFAQCEDLFETSVSNGFEFTHHDVISNARDIDSFARKVSRLRQIRQKKDVVFLYHHRRNNNTDIARLTSKLDDFRALYESDNVRCGILAFSQSPIKKRLSDISEL